LVDLAQEALRLADAEPRQAVVLGLEALRRARRHPAAGSVARRALGVAALHMEDPDTAIRHLRAAAGLGRRADSVQLVAEARVDLAKALNVRGRPNQALREITGVLALDLEVPLRARALAQRATLLGQLGRHDEALEAYQRVVPILRRSGDLTWLWRALNNRALIHAYRHEFAGAEADLREAERLCRELDLELSVGFVHQNLGWVAGMRGDVPTALRYLDQAQDCFTRLGADLGEVLTDRTQLLLSALLVTEAHEAAEQALAVVERGGRALVLAEARLLLAQTALRVDRRAQAVDQAGHAATEFEHQGRTAWAALARYVVAQVDGMAQQDLDQLADELTAARWITAAVETRLIAGRHALAEGRVDVGLRHLEHVARFRTRGHVLLRARGWYAEALVRTARGNRRGARIAVRCGLRVVDEHRATFGASDLRAHAAGHRVDLAEVGLGLALADGRPAGVLRWAEEGRASRLLLRPIRPPDDPELAQKLAELRATVGAIRDAIGANRSTARLNQRRIELERAVRDRTRRLPSDATGPSPRPPTPAEIVAQVGDAALVEFVVVGGVLHAVTVVDGLIGLRRIGELGPIVEVVEGLPFPLRRLVRTTATPASRAAAGLLVRHLALELDRLVLDPILDAVGDRPLVLVPTGALQSLPWSILPSCRGRAVTVAPSAALWCAARSSVRRGSGVVVAAGPDLPGAHAEAGVVAALHGTEPLLGAAAATAAVKEALGVVRIAHIAAHGNVHPDNPLFSAIRLADGPFTVYELEHVRWAPELVVLSSCNVGRAAVTAGGELLGLTAAFLGRGTHQVVASVMPVPDAETIPLMTAFHELLLAGRSAAVALAEAQVRADPDDLDAVAAAAGFVCLGADWAVDRSAPRAEQAGRVAVGVP
jgi:hypothetical protein